MLKNPCPAAKNMVGLAAILGGAVLVAVWAGDVWRAMNAPPSVPWQTYYNAQSTEYRARIEPCAAEMHARRDDDFAGPAQWKLLPTCADLPFRVQIDAHSRATDFFLEDMRREFATSRPTVHH